MSRYFNLYEHRINIIYRHIADAPSYYGLIVGYGHWSHNQTKIILYEYL